MIVSCLSPEENQPLGAQRLQRRTEKFGHLAVDRAVKE